MNGDPYNLRIGIRPEETENYPWNLPYISVFAITFELPSFSQIASIGTTGPDYWRLQGEQESAAISRELRMAVD